MVTLGRGRQHENDVINYSIQQNKRRSVQDTSKKKGKHKADNKN